MKTYRDLSRLESVTHSPIMNHLAETLSGATTIRNFKKEEDFIKMNYEKIDVNVNVNYWQGAVRRWFSIRLELTSKLIIIVTSGFLVRTIPI